MSCDVAEIAVGLAVRLAVLVRTSAVWVFSWGDGFRLERISFLDFSTGYLLLGSAPRKHSPVSDLTRIVSRYGGWDLK